MKKWMMAVAVCGCVVTACDKEDENTLNQVDRDYVVLAGHANNAEVLAGQLAASKGQSDLVKQFGQMMVTEHTMAQQDLKARASALGLAVPDTADAAHQALVRRLDTLTGHSFDTAYINSQVTDHTRTLQLFNIEILDGRHEQIRGYATQYRPHIQMHLLKADSIRTVM
jgi:putative membrane protein